MSTEHPSPLMPEDGDLEEAREAEIQPLEAPKPGSNWRRWAAVGTLAVVGGAVFAVTWHLSGQVPAEGHAVAEARITALVTLGATAGAAAVSLAAVVLTLGLQREQQQQQRWADFQMEILREAHEWIDDVYRRFGQVIGAIQEWGNAVGDDRNEKLAEANRVAQSFYDHGQRLGEVERLERLVADRAVRTALRHADGALRSWNETVAGDHTTREVRVHEAEGEEWSLFGSLGDARDSIRAAYSEAVRAALSGR